VNPEFVSRLADGDAGSSSALSFRNTMNALYWAPSHREPREREDLLVAEVLRSRIGDDGYPGDAAPSANWPGTAPGTRGILNALSPKNCDWSRIVELDPKPRVLWTHGSRDLIISDTSALEMGTLGRLGAVPGWPGEQAYPPQPMVTQIADVLRRYADAGGKVRTEIFEGSGHFPVADAAEAWRAVFLEFLAG
jgi:pimeloyl-ACP methyl ester carboxylesterase